MRVYWKRPDKAEARIVRPDNEGDEYEVWVLKPVLVGTILKAGSQRLMADGVPYANLNAAAQSLLDSAGEMELAGGMQLSINRGAERIVRMTGLDMIEKGAWLKFCESRKINPRSVNDMNKSYQLTPIELKRIGI